MGRVLSVTPGPATCFFGRKQCNSSTGGSADVCCLGHQFPSNLRSSFMSAGRRSCCGPWRGRWMITLALPGTTIVENHLFDIGGAWSSIQGSLSTSQAVNHPSWHFVDRNEANCPGKHIILYLVQCDAPHRHHGAAALELLQHPKHIILSRWNTSRVAAPKNIGPEQNCFAWHENESTSGRAQGSQT